MIFGSSIGSLAQLIFALTNRLTGRIAPSQMDHRVWQSCSTSYLRPSQTLSLPCWVKLARVGCSEMSGPTATQEPSGPAQSDDDNAGEQSRQQEEVEQAQHQAGQLNGDKDPGEDADALRAGT